VDYNDVDSLCNDIDAAFSHKSGPTLSSIHRAKGLERERVYVIQPTRMPTGGQEENLKYIAVTRAKQSLIYLPERYNLR
jgi:superfamily I DNA and RNA helicase